MTDGQVPLPAGFADNVKRTPDGTAWRVHETASAYIDVMPMLFNDRLVVTPRGGPLSYGRFWCYPKGPAAILAALAWDGSDDTEPVGWIKSWDQRYRDPL